MRAPGVGRQEALWADVGVTAEQLRQEGDIRTAGAGEPGTDVLLPAALRSTPAPAHLALALWYD